MTNVLLYHAVPGAPVYAATALGLTSPVAPTALATKSLSIGACLFKNFPKERAVEETHSSPSPNSGGWVESAWTNNAVGAYFTWVSAWWTVPNAPRQSYGSNNQVYFTFPGVESAQYIVQPVLQYNWWGTNSAGFVEGRPNGWQVASWHCNSGSDCVHGNLVNVSPGDTIYGTAQASNCNAAGNCSWTITTQDFTTNAASVLTVTDSQVYLYGVGAAVETYGLTSCDQYPISGVNYTNVTLRLSNGNLANGTGFTNVVSGGTPSCNFAASSTITTVTLKHGCQPVTSCAGVTCGTISDGCGGTVTCGPSCACGGLNQRCCTGDTCKAGLTCNGLTCNNYR